MPTLLIPCTPTLLHSYSVGESVRECTHTLSSLPNQTTISHVSLLFFLPQLHIYSLRIILTAEPGCDPLAFLWVCVCVFLWPKITLF